MTPEAQLLSAFPGLQIERVDRADFRPAWKRAPRADLVSAVRAVMEREKQLCIAYAQRMNTSHQWPCPTAISDSHAVTSAKCFMPNSPSTEHDDVEFSFIIKDQRVVLDQALGYPCYAQTV